MIESVAHVRRTIAEGDGLLVSFAEHDAYFRAGDAVRPLFAASDIIGRKVRFRYDAELEILAAQLEA